MHASKSFASMGLVVLACISGCAREPAPKPAADLAITQATVIDPGTASIVKDADIVVKEGRIVAVGPGSADSYMSAQTIDASGKYIVPAFTDMHMHWGNGTFAEDENLVQTTLARTLYYGVTRILNMGANRAAPAEIDELRRKLAEGTLQGPKIYAVGSLMTVPGSHPTTTIFPPPMQKQIADTVAAAPPEGPIDLMPLRAITLLRSPDDARIEVKRLAAWGANAIKITIESGPGPYGDDHPQMPEDVVRAVVEEAHATKIPVVAHISSRDELEVCLRTGVDAAAHASTTGPFDETLHQQMGAQEFFYIATLDLYDGFVNWSTDLSRMNDPFLRETLTEAQAASMQAAPQIFVREQEFIGPEIAKIGAHVRDAGKAGAILLTGTDTGNPFAFPGYGIHQELHLMVEAGVTPMNALAAATINPARFFKEQNQWGSIAVGQAADLLVLEADPVADIMNTRKIAQLIQAGRVVDRAALPVK